MSIWSLPVGVFAFLGKLIQLNNWSFPLFGFSQLVELRVNNVCICTREEHLPPCCFPALRSSCSSVRWHCCITTGNLAPKTGPKKGWVGNKVSKWSGNISEEIFGLKDSLCVKHLHYETLIVEKDFRGVGGKILHACTSWARKGPNINNEAVVSPNCTWCVITVIAARQRERGGFWWMFSRKQCRFLFTGNVMFLPCCHLKCVHIMK